jgi:surface protein
VRLPRTYVSISPPLAPAAAQGYKMRNEKYDDDGNIINPDHDGGIRTAARVWYEDPAAAKARYGPIASWDVSEVTDLSFSFQHQADFNEDLSRWDVSNVTHMLYMFRGATSFNGDLSSWNVSNVVNMDCMFHNATSFNGDLSSWNVSNVVHMYYTFAGATSFDRQLGGAWATNTANKYRMFRDSPGTIAGKTKDANGTIE